MIETALNDQLDLFFFKRLGQIVVCTLFDGLDRSLKRSEGGQYDDRGVLAHALELAEHCQSIDRPHTDIREHQIHPALAASCNGFFPAAVGFDAVALFLQGLRQQIPRNSIVIYHQNLCSLHDVSTPSLPATRPSQVTRSSRS